MDYCKSGGGVRQWANEIAEDILRLEGLEQDVAGYTDRALIIGGIRRSLKGQFLNVEVRAGNGNPRIRILPHILQDRELDNSSYPYEQERIAVRDCDPSVRKFWTARAEDIGGELPVSYQCTLAGRHRASQTQDSVEIYVWLVRRSRNRAAFDVNAHFTDL